MRTVEPMHRIHAGLRSDAQRFGGVAKIAFEKYFLLKIRHGNTSPIYEEYVLKALPISGA